VFQVKVHCHGVVMRATDGKVVAPTVW